jgi:phosphopantetheine adenylyltransferase
MDWAFAVVIICAMVFGTGIIGIIADTITKTKNKKVKGEYEDRIKSLESEVELIKSNKLLDRVNAIEDIILMDSKLDKGDYHKALDYKASGDEERQTKDE